jgi:hemerythrin-like domain-containing protein
LICRKPRAVFLHYVRSMHTLSPPPARALQILRDEHNAVAAVLRSLQLMMATGPGDAPERFFDVLRAMLFYIDEFPERLHHPSESNVLFPRVARARPEVMPVIARLEQDHVQGEARVRELQHLLLAWELLGESRRGGFAQALGDYVDFYLRHMRLEEKEILPVAQACLSGRDWAEIDAEFASERDPLASGVRDERYDRLFTRIVLHAPAPVGVGPALDEAS